ncbi:orotidine-5'-phosphate decarboxylase [Hansschlegelia plantiphila]|uniref:Orotidine 5'-phosphate decarboxylase n=1 Tax=Hansschlegelia plantiphila TaxID=374655 RepID=A0A9W6MW78_9HYPH|nr:orotidine-5'-phosphate decarboxylase [Hansschlegelia plantiphila]GLK68711.1 orotidine 5'-phosphate decarboxylase [Hansschlegelia plantiphila]
MSGSATVEARERLIVGLDVASLEEAEALVLRLGDSVVFYKIGFELAVAGGLLLAERLVGSGKKVFVDLKLHDIGATVEKATRNVARLGATFLTVHAYPQTLRAAAAGRGDSGLKVLGVTVLTSWDAGDVAEAGFIDGPEALVARRVAQTRDAGADGVICAPTDLSAVRAIAPRPFLAVTPGVRPAGAALGDQKRVATPAEAIRAGADRLVVARPVIGAADPRAAAEAIVDEIARALIAAG